ncbi:MAG: serine hydrolase [Acidobacteriota bacterium]
MRRPDERALSGWIGIALVWACLGVSASAQDRPAQIDAYLAKLHDLHQFDGAVLVADAQGVFFKKAYGMADREWDVPNTPATKFRIGSITKQFTAALVLQLVEEGRLTLDSKLSEVLPYYRKDSGEMVTVRHLLNHTSGIPSLTQLPSFQEIRARNPHSVEETVKRFCSGDLQFPPGTQFRYNNSGYYILGAVIEKVAGKPYEQVLRERITGPLKMNGTGYDRGRDILPSRASGYQRFPGGVRNCSYIDMGVPFAAGALYSTVEDLYQWDRALDSGQVLSDSSKKAMFMPGLGHYGLGWYIRKAPVGPGNAERLVLSHSGGIEGFTAHLRRLPEEKIFVVVLDNCTDGRLEVIADGILDVLFGRVPPPPRRSVAEVFYQAHRKSGAGAAVALLRELQVRGASEYDFSEAAINLLGYQLLGEREPDAAVAVFQINAELHPDSSNVYDSLGEGLAALGKRDDAVRAYARSLTLDPSNRNAVEWLDRLSKQPAP